MTPAQRQAKKAMQLYSSGQASSLKEAWRMVKGGKKSNPRKRKNTAKRKNFHHNPKRRRNAAITDAEMIREVLLSTENEEMFYRQVLQPTEKNLGRHLYRGKFNRALAMKSFLQVANLADKFYQSSFSAQRRGTWRSTKGFMLSVADRKQLAAEYLESRMERIQDYADEMEAGVKYRDLNNNPKRRRNTKDWWLARRTAKFQHKGKTYSITFQPEDEQWEEVYTIQGEEFIVVVNEEYGDIVIYADDPSAMGNYGEVVWTFQKANPRRRNSAMTRHLLKTNKKKRAGCRGGTNKAGGNFVPTPACRGTRAPHAEAMAIMHSEGISLAAAWKKQKKTPAAKKKKAAFAKKKATKKKTTRATKAPKMDRQGQLALFNPRSRKRKNFHHNPKRRSNGRYMTKADFDAMFKEEYIPMILQTEMSQGSRFPDRPMRREAYNNAMDSFAQDGQISEDQAFRWSHPAWLETFGFRKALAEKKKREMYGYNNPRKRKNARTGFPYKRWTTVEGMARKGAKATLTQKIVGTHPKEKIATITYVAGTRGKYPYAWHIGDLGAGKTIATGTSRTLAEAKKIADKHLKASNPVKRRNSRRLGQRSYIRFYTNFRGKQIELLGSDGMFLLDGRNTLDTAIEDGFIRADRLKKVQHITGFQIRQGTERDRFADKPLSRIIQYDNRKK